MFLNGDAPAGENSRRTFQARRLKVQFFKKLVKAAEYSVCQRDSGGRFWTMS
ncbi:hypothetical protein D3C78_1374870 [compost metagenome]